MCWIVNLWLAESRFLQCLPQIFTNYFTNKRNILRNIVKMFVTKGLEIWKMLFDNCL